MNITATHHIVNDRTAGSMPVWQGRKVANVQSQSVEKLAAVEPGRKDAVVAEESVLIQNTSKSTYRSSMAVPKVLCAPITAVCLAKSDSTGCIRIAVLSTLRPVMI